MDSKTSTLAKSQRKNSNPHRNHRQQATARKRREERGLGGPDTGGVGVGVKVEIDRPRVDDGVQDLGPGDLVGRVARQVQREEAPAQRKKCAVNRRR